MQKKQKGGRSCQFCVGSLEADGLASRPKSQPLLFGLEKDKKEVERERER